MSKINFNASGEQMTDEVHSDVGAGEFSLDHSVFLQSGFLCSRLSGGTQPLTYGVDYILTSINERLRTEAGLTSYQKVKVLNAAYQTGALYFTYKAVADFLDVEDWDAGTVNSLHANDNAITDNDTTLATKNKVKTYADTKIAKTTNVTAIDDTGIADGEIAVFNLTAKTIKTSDKVFSTDGTLAGNSDSNVPTQKAVKTYADTKLAKSENLNDLADKATARTNLDVYNKAGVDGSSGSSGTAYYRKLSSGLIIQWGTTGAGETTITLPTAFANTNYGVSGSHNSSDYGFYVVTKAAGSFTISGRSSTQTVNWIAIGY